jgi:ubiquinone/menaquinone biosynthesis C-methylase UbiE
MKNVKEIVKDKYGQIARNADNSTSGVCGCCDDNMDYSIMSDDYSHMKGYVIEADMNLGCGLPTEYAHISKGDTVVDLGSGAGNDCFVAEAECGSEGKVIGVDFTEDMVSKARKNAERLGKTNVEFVQGDIEDIPLPESIADVVVSNCVMNLVPDKVKAFSETYRILKPGGHFSISDIVLEGDLPVKLREDASMYAGCVASAIQKNDYLRIIEQVGFEEMTILKKKPIQLPDELLSAYLSKGEIKDFNVKQGIYSITVFAKKP